MVQVHHRFMPVGAPYRNFHKRIITRGIILTMLPLIPSYVVSALSLGAGIMFILGLLRIHKMTRKSIIIMLSIGIPFVVGGLALYAVIYYIFTVENIDSELRQRWVRFALAYLFSVIIIWQSIILRFGEKL